MALTVLQKLSWFFKELWPLKGIIVTILVILAPLHLVLNTDSSVARCGYTVIVMAVMWLTEALPIPVTALIPIFLLPMLGVSSAKEVSGSYVTDTSMLFLGGLIMAVAVEECGLHRRIALFVLRIVGTQPNLLMLGLMLPTWFLSMWISNTAAASMMVPIVAAVTSEMKDAKVEDTNQVVVTEEVETNTLIPAQHKYGAIIGNDSNKNVQLQAITPIKEPDLNTAKSDAENPSLNTELPQEIVKPSTSHATDTKSEHKKMCKALALSIAYAANTGGIATLTGSPPNLVFKGQADDLFYRQGKAFDGVPRSSGITFSNWLAVSLPISFLVMILGWIWLQLFHLKIRSLCGCCKQQRDARDASVRRVINDQYRAMGKVSFAEVMVALMFLCLAMLWIFREPPNIPGWGDIFRRGTEKYVADSTPAILISILLFLLPAERPSVFCWKKDSSKKASYTPLLNWQTTMLKLPWGVILLLGGGFALAKASDKSGLSEWVGEGLNVFNSYEPWVMNMILCSIVAAATEVTSNTATATLLMPILAKLAVSTGLNPLYLMMSAAIACSFAFMLPVATPPSAIVFAHGYLTIPDMAKCGFVMNILAVFVLTVSMNTWGLSMFSLDVLPEIFQRNTTLMNNETFIKTL